MTKQSDRAAFDDSELRYVGWSATCGRCRHRVGHRRLACAAFPERIPREIWNGERDHEAAYPGDGGILFEPMTEADSEHERQLADEAIARYRRLTAEMQARRAAAKSPAA